MFDYKIMVLLAVAVATVLYGLYKLVDYDTMENERG